MTDERMTEGLAPFFEAARREADTMPGPSEALMARILAEAATAQPKPVPDRVPGPEPERVRASDAAGPRPLAVLLAVLGGWPAVASLVAVAGIGVVMGYSPPAAFDQVVWDMDPVEMSFGADFLTGLDTFSEGGLDP